MDTYFSIFKIKPLKTSDFASKVKIGDACIWTRAFSTQGAKNSAIQSIDQNNWEILKIQQEPVLVYREQFIDQDEGLKHFDIAQKERVSSFYNLVSIDGKTQGYLEESPKDKSHLAKIYSALNSIDKYGHCLHFDSGYRCNELIKAHSIQKSGQLQRISVKDHVYCISKLKDRNSNYSDLQSHTKISTRKMSTFKGFCKYHDNLVFEAIDNTELIPSNQQAFLYAYRSLCKEIIVKENTIQALSEIEKSSLKNSELIDGSIEGNKKGLNDLLYHKKKFDVDLSEKKFNRIQYVLFESNQLQNCAFSGLKYPHYDFFENLLQDLSEQTKHMKLITFCSAPMKNGWGYLFAWHKSSAKICQKFINSLLHQVKKGQSLQDHLFRLTQHSENKAFSPIWWEDLPETRKQELNLYIERYLSLYEPIFKDETTYGLKGITDWEFEKALSNYRKVSI